MSHKRSLRYITISVVIILTLSLVGCGNKGESFYTAAMKDYKKGNYEKADENFTKAIKLKDDNADYYIDHAFCLMQLKKYDEAKASFEKAILDKNNSIVKKNNKKAYRGLGILYYLTGDYKNSLTSFNKAMEYQTLSEYDDDILSYVGNLNLLLGDNESALENYDKILSDKPKDKQALIGRARANFGLAKYEESSKDYLAAKNIDGKDFVIYFGLYEAYTAANDTQAAASILDEATNIQPKDTSDSKYRYNLAKVHYYQGNLDQALDEFIGVSEEGYVEGNYFIGDIYFSNKEYASAVTYYERYLQAESPIDSQFYDKLSTCYLQTEQYEKALQMIQQGLSMNGAAKKQNLLRNEIIAYEHTGDFQTAYSKMETYVSTFPDDEDAKRDMEFLATRQGNGIENGSNEEEPKDTIVKP